MKRTPFSLLMLVVIVIWPFSVHAASMRCELRQVLKLSADGDLVPHPLASEYLANDLIVDLETGVIYHLGFGNESYPIKNVLDAGSRSSSFKVIASSIPGRVSDYDHSLFANTVVMQIDTWVDSVEKPFVVLESSNIGTGVCR